MKKSTVFSIICWLITGALLTHTYMTWNNPVRVIDHDTCTKESLSMQVQLGPYFDEFIKDCEIYGVSPDHVYCLKGMGFSETMQDNGYTDYTDRVIRLNSMLLNDSIGLRFVLYHELGHWLGLRHSDGIMEDSYARSNSTWVQENWDYLKDQHFKRLKK